MRRQVKIYQKKIVARRRRRALLLSLYFALALALIASGLSYASFLPSFEIKEILIKGHERADVEAIRTIVLDKIDGAYLGLFSKRNSLLYPREEVRGAVLSLPLFKDARIVRENLGAVAVLVAERTEHGVWCRENDCYSMDENGFIFAPRESGLLARYVYRGGIAGDPVGSYYLDQEAYRSISFFIQQLSALSLDPRDIAMHERGNMTIRLGAGGSIILNSKDDLSVILANIAALVTDKTVAPSFFDFLANLDYIKVDSGNKLVFKMK